MCVCGFPSSLCLTGCLPALLHLVLHLRHCLRPISCSVVGTAWYTCGLSDIKTFLWALLEFQIIQDVVSEVSFPLGTIHVQATQQCPAHLGQLVETFTKLLWSVCSTDSKLDNMRTWRVILCGIKRCEGWKTAAAAENACWSMESPKTSHNQRALTTSNYYCCPFQWALFKVVTTWKPRSL